MFNECQMSKLKKSEAIAVEREREIQQASQDVYAVPFIHIDNFLMTDQNWFFFPIQKVVESVSELAQIMRDLSVLVIDQVRKWQWCMKSSKFLQPSSN